MKFRVFFILAFLIAVSGMFSVADAQDHAVDWKIVPGDGKLTITFHDAKINLTHLQLYVKFTPPKGNYVELKPADSTLSDDTHTRVYTFTTLPDVPSTLYLHAQTGFLVLFFETPYDGKEQGRTDAWGNID